MLNEVLTIILIILSVPVGYLIAYLCNDELISIRKWLRLIIYCSLLIGIVSIFFKDFVLLYTMIFVLVVTAISLKQSFNKKWTKKRMN